MRAARKPLTEAEKAERRAQMAADAQQHTAQRKGRFQQEGPNPNPSPKPKPEPEPDPYP